MNCIYCKSSTTGSEGIAHILQEGVCENNFTLPRGMECDQCNQYLGKLDNVLILHNHIWPCIQILGLRGKKNKLRKKIRFFENK